MPIVKRQDKRNSGYGWYAYRCKVSGSEYKSASSYYGGWRKKAEHAHYLYTQLTEILGPGIPFILTKVHMDENEDRIPKWAFEVIKDELLIYLRSQDEADVVEKLLTVLALTNG